MQKPSPKRISAWVIEVNGDLYGPFDDRLDAQLYLAAAITATPVPLGAAGYHHITVESASIRPLYETPDVSRFSRR